LRKKVPPFPGKGNVGLLPTHYIDGENAIAKETGKGTLPYDAGGELMATNPRIPTDQEKGPQLVRPDSELKNPNPPSSGFPGVLIAITVAVVLLGAAMYYLPRAPKRTPPPSAAQVPIQPTGSQLQLSHLESSMAPTGGAMYLDGRS
jgi:hypothetical protein